MTVMEEREFELRTVDKELRQVAGIAVPYGTPANIRNEYTEVIQRGAVVPVEEVGLKWRHKDSIGSVIESRDTDEGYFIRAQLDESPLGNAAFELVKDGLVNKFSIGFLPLEARTDEDGNVVRTNIELHEVSIVPNPAYIGAGITEVREDSINKEEQVMTDVITVADLDEVREEVREIRASLVVKEEPQLDTRSAGEVLKAIVRGEERAYTGGTSADAIVKNGWVGDLTRIVEAAAPLRGVFASASLPNEGNFIEYGQLKSDTSAFAKQAAEGDDLTFGKVQLETKTAPVYTYGGYTQLTRQEIERSSTNILDAALRAQAVKVGQVLNGVLRADYKALHAANLAANQVDVSAAAGYNGWLDAIIEAAVKFDALGLPMTALVADKATFKALTKLEGSDGRPVMLVTGAGVNNVGNIDVKGLAGDIANIKVVLDAGLAANEAAFVNSNAIRFYTAPVVRLQDENIINLSKDFSVYTYAAVADEIPAAVVPVKPVA